MTKRIKIKWKSIILIFIFLVLFIIFIISAVNILKWIIDSNNSKKQISSIIENTNITEIKDSKNTEYVIDEENIDALDPYWDYIKYSLIDVDFNNLKEENQDTVGWIQVKGTNINYPFVQTSDNDFYLKHSFNKKYNNAGWVFMDYRNKKDEYDKNTIIYAHGRYDNTMFGSLRKILSSDWTKNINNHVITISTEYENTLWQVFSVYKIKTTNDYLETNFTNEDSFLKFSKMLMDRSEYNFNTIVDKNDKILTLSTCYDDDYKVVLHAKLIKREKK